MTRTTPVPPPRRATLPLPLPLPLLAALAAALAAGCASAPPPRTLLALPPTVAAAADAPAAVPADAPVLAVRRLEIPEHLQSRRVRYRADAATVKEWPDTVWAERIEAAMTREFVAALRPRLPGWQLCESSCNERLPGHAITVELQPLDFVRAEHRLRGQARIALATTGAGARPLGSTQLSIDVPAAADTPQAQAEALSEMLRRVAQAVPALLPAAGTPPTR